MELGQYLKKCRELKSRTQPDIAGEIGIEQSYLSKLESGKSIPSNDVFDKLREVYGFNIEELVKALSPKELDRLKDIGAIQQAYNIQSKNKLTASRAWSVSGLVMLVLGTGLLAISILPDRSPETFIYRSQGILEKNEELNAYDIIKLDIQLLGSDASRLAERTQMLSRLDQADVTTNQYKGDGYVVNHEQGRRYFELIGKKTSTRNDWNRWLFVPALMLLVGGIGSFFLASRWTPPSETY